MGKLEKIVQKFKELHHSDPLVVRSPGRINMIGEHVDYNFGSVLPGAINYNIYMAIGLRRDNLINIFASDYGDPYIISLNDLKPAWKLWPNYPLGVINELKRLNFDLKGLNIVLGGDIPLGAGLSSSAATTCSTVFAINELLNLGLSRERMVEIAQLAEHNFVGVKCGIMDQFASLFGKKNELIRLDCKSNTYDYIPFDPQGISIVLFDTKVKHHLVSSEYNSRRKECEQALTLVKRNVNNVADYNAVTEDMLLKYVKQESSLLFNRALYVIEENLRLNEACAAIRNEDFEKLGQLMFKTHQGLKDLYEVSCPECDFLVDRAKLNLQVLGARMMGGGFGGCTINLVYKDALEMVCEQMKAAYKIHFGKELKVYEVSLNNGTEIVKDTYSL